SAQVRLRPDEMHPSGGDRLSRRRRRVGSYSIIEVRQRLVEPPVGHRIAPPVVRLTRDRRLRWESAICSRGSVMPAGVGVIVTFDPRSAPWELHAVVAHTPLSSDRGLNATPAPMHARYTSNAGDRWTRCAGENGAVLRTRPVREVSVTFGRSIRG